ncbi:cilia- and flagella-associated protein 251-like [Herrania umbratica]|uniref:Cilia- and flagella-associated protein 251-like n=1 Tax=Herrania umbratica TaxID=108875 RepID=A0A6J1AJ83_9ROSI|nr:cilia- and flagella-associated protein 251-like [Herrania umbratica]
MDTVKAEKVQAMNKYRKRDQFLYNLILHLLAGLACSLFFSYAYWFPSLCSSMKHFFLISLPCIWSSFSNPKCLFVVVNVIVIFLVGESRFTGKNSSPAGDIYNEYIERSRSLRKVPVSTTQEKTRQKKMVEEGEKDAESKQVVNRGDDKGVEEEDEELAEAKEVMKPDEKEEKEEEKEAEAKKQDRVVQETYGVVEEEGSEEKENDIVEEEAGLPAEELNKRVEEFIARVNKQRWLEAQLVVCCRA